MARQKIFTILFTWMALAGVATAAFGDATQPPCNPTQTNLTPAVIPQVQPVLKKIVPTITNDDESPPIADVFFKYEAQSTGGAVHVTGVSPEALLTTNTVPISMQKVIPRLPLPEPVTKPIQTTLSPLMSPLSQVWQLFNASFGAAGSIPGAPTVTNFNQSMALLARYGSSMSLDQKLLYLSLLGEKLQTGYNAIGLASKTNEQIFANAIQETQNGGVCGNIHDYLAEAARNLGFKNSGISSAIWNQDGRSAGHYVAYFQDPKSGNYYTDNYGIIYNTNQKNVQSAIDVTTRILGPLTSASMIETSPGVFHNYVPTLSRWINTELGGATEYTPGSPLIKASFGNQENTFVLQDGKEIAPGVVAGGFAIHSQRSEDDGVYQIDAAGAVIQSQNDYGTALYGVVNDMALESKIYAGVMNVEVPNLVGAPLTATHNFSIIGNGSVKGTAQINAVTGKLELSAFSTDFQTPGMAKSQNGLPVLSGVVQLTPGAEYHAPGSLITYSAERNIQMTATNNSAISLTLKTAFDRFSVIIDNREGDPKVYIANRSDIYVFEGINTRAATGIRDSIKAAVPVGKFGEFSVIADINKVISNPSQDPFYDSPFNASIGASWRKLITRSIEVGAGASISSGVAPFLFSDPGSTYSPEITNNTRQIRGSVWIRTSPY